MSQLTYCPIGGQDGILVTDEELNAMANSLKSEYLDAVIPLPQTNDFYQISQMKDCKHDNVGYWERTNGYHGWCCMKCGTVVQWG